jgi:hypothetical protein
VLQVVGISVEKLKLDTTELKCCPHCGNCEAVYEEDVFCWTLTCTNCQRVLHSDCTSFRAV